MNVEDFDRQLALIDRRLALHQARMAEINGRLWPKPPKSAVTAFLRAHQVVDSVELARADYVADLIDLAEFERRAAAIVEREDA